MITDSNRTQDKFGYLTVENCILTGEDVAKYFGYEIPYCKRLGLDEKTIYHVYRPKDEIQDANFSNKPLLSRHADFSAEDYKAKLVVGTIGETIMDGDQTKGTVVFWDKKAIDELEKGMKFLSCGYMYEPIVEKGFYNNSGYDIKMSNIVANHVAMVDNPRYKPAIVADEDIKTEKGASMLFKNKKNITKDKDKEWTFDAALKDCMDKDMSDEEKEEKVKEIKEKMSKDKAKAKDKKDEAMDPGEDPAMADDKDLEEKEEEKNDEETMGTSFKGKKKMTGDTAINIQKLVADSVAIEIEKITKKTVAFDSAIREYERTCGRVNRAAFDSANEVLETILKNNKRSFEGKSFEQKQAMVEMLPSHRNTQNVQTVLTIDSASATKSHTPSSILNFLKGKL